MGKIRVTVTRLARLNESTRGKPHNPKEAVFFGYLYKLTGPFFSTKHLTILDQKACVPSDSLFAALTTDPARILVYDEYGARQIETSEIMRQHIDGKSAIVETNNCRYEIIVQ